MSRDDDFFDDAESDYDRYERQPRKKKGMSGGMKIFVILLCIFGGMMLLCCGVGVYFFLQIKKGVSVDPAVVSKVTQEIVTIDIPKEFSPKQSVVVDVPVIPKIKMVSYLGTKTAGLLMIMELDVPLEDFNEEQQEEVRDKFQLQGNETVELKNAVLVYKVVEIRGQKVRFKFVAGINEETGTKIRQVEGVFQGKNGILILSLQVPEEHYKEADVLKMLKSIK